MSPDPAGAFPGLTDLHAHPAMNAFLWDRDLRRHYWAGHTFNPLASLTDFKMLEKGGVKVLWSSLHIPEREYFDCFVMRLAARFTRGGRTLRELDAWQCLLVMMGEMEAQVARAGDRFEVAHTNAELDRVVAAGKTAIVHTVEGGHVLGAGLEAGDLDGRLARLERLAERGVASLTLAHLFRNDIAGHANAIPETHKIPFCKLDAGVEPERGLDQVVGRAVVDRMVELRMVPDVSHCTPNARRQVYERVANRIPVVATHTGVRSLRNVDYNLDKSDVEAIAGSGGVAGVIFMPYWLDESKPKKGLDVIWRTMEQLREWSGSWEHVAIGTDFDGFTDPPDDCASSGELPKIRDRLDEEGLSTAEVEAVLGGNARRVLKKGWR
jgi:microsomal dipeptidase-like Zn-dependent dipeptidase